MTTNLIRSVGKYFRAIKSTPLFHYSSVSIPVKVVLLWPLHYYLLVIPLIHGIKEMCSICSVCLLVEKGLSNIILFWWFLHQIISVMWYLTVFYVVKRLLCFILSSPFLPSPLLYSLLLLSSPVFPSLAHLLFSIPSGQTPSVVLTHPSSFLSPPL